MLRTYITVLQSYLTASDLSDGAADLSDLLRTYLTPSVLSDASGLILRMRIYLTAADLSDGDEDISDGFGLI